MVRATDQPVGQMTVRRHPSLLLALAIAAVVLGGCSASFSTGSDSIGKDEVAKKAMAQLNPVLTAGGLAPLPEVTCPHDLNGKAGAKITCTSTGDFGDGVHGTVDVKVRVTSVSDSGGNLHFHVPLLGKKEIAREAKAKLDPAVEAAGHSPLPPITCPTDLYLLVGATAHCTAKGSFGGGLTGTLAITATIRSLDAKGANLHFSTANRVE